MCNEQNEERKMNSHGGDLDQWRQRLADLPDVRLQKVQSVRGAIERSCYENEQVLETTIHRLSNDVGILCRKDSGPGST